MRGLSIGLGLGSRNANPYAAYAANGIEPEVIADFAGNTYRDNAGNTAFADMFTFTRASSATYFDSDGILQTASSGTARTASYVYNGTSWVNRGILLESEARTNIVTYSDTSAGWNSTSGLSVVRTGDTGDKITTLTVTSAGIRAIYPAAAITVTTAVDYSFSVEFDKSSTQEFVVLAIHNGATTSGNEVLQSFNLQTGAVGTAYNTSPNHVYSEDLGTHWRFTFSWALPGGSTSANLAIFPTATDVNPRVSGVTNTGKTTILRRVQFEQGSAPSSYIPTSGATATRAAETLSIAAANMAFDSADMSFAMSGLINYADEGAAAQQTFFRWQADANNYISIDLDTDSTATGEVNANQAASGTVDTVVAGAEYSPGLNVAFSVASRNTDAAINVAKDGTAATEDATPTALAALGSTAFELGYDFMGHVDTFLQWGADIGDTGIEEASA